MQSDFKFTYVVMGIQGALKTSGAFQLNPNRMIAELSQSMESCWYGDVIVGKTRRGVSGENLYEDVTGADYCLIRNYFLHQ